MANIIIPKKLDALKDLVTTEQIFDYIEPSELFNYFTDMPASKRLKDPLEEFVQLCRTNLGFATKTIIGRGAFELLPFQTAILDVLWEKTFPLLIMTRGGGKSTLLSLYAVLRAVLDQNSSSGSKIVIVSGSFRQSKLIMEQIEGWYKDSPILQACCEIKEGLRRSNDKWEFQFGKSTIVALPLGDGQKIRGVRASHILVDETGAVPMEIFNVVIRGFAAVSQNPIDKVRAIMRRDKLLSQGMKIEDVPDLPKGNQIIRSGTGDYYFNHFFKTYESYTKILTHKLKGFGDDPKIKSVLGKAEGSGLDKSSYIDYRNYAIIQIPHTAIPRGFMDETMINEAKMDISESQFDMEYNAKFVTDSKGFFRASSIEAATPKLNDPLYFRVELFGDLSARYVMGIDPARKVDLFALFIIKITNNSHQIVYLNEWKQKNFGELALEIRRLKKLFHVTRIGIDQGGGGSAIMDFLSTKEMIPDGELPFFEIDSKEVTACEKIIDPINYMGSWLKSANYDLQADIEHGRLLFPYRGDYDIKDIGTVDKYDEIFDLIKELKKQLTQIEITATDKTEVEHFDLPPEIKWKQHKDLYSALLIAAYEARQIKQKEIRTPVWSEAAIGGSVDEFAS